MAKNITPQYTYQVQHINPLTNTVLQILLQPKKSQSLSYQAGQYLELFTQDGTHFPYSIANAPLGANQLELHIRHTPDNAFTHHLLEEIKSTGEIQIAGAFGHCIYNTNQPKPTLLLAGGTGFAPMKALIEQALASGHIQPMHLYWGAKNAYDLYLDALPQQWALSMPHFKYTRVLLSPEGDKTDLTAEYGFIQDVLECEYNDLSSYQVFAAGPYEMVTTLWECVHNRGVARNQFHTDLF